MLAARADVLHDKLPSMTEGQPLALLPIDAASKGTLRIQGRFIKVTPPKAKDGTVAPTHSFARLFVSNPDKRLEGLKVNVRYFLMGATDSDLAEQPAEDIAVDYVEKQQTAIETKGYDLTVTKKDPKDHKPAQPTNFLGIILTIKDSAGTIIYCGVSDTSLKKAAKGQ